MTCIVGVVDKKAKKVLIGGDSAESNGTSIIIRKDVKVFKNGDFVFGCTTSFRMIQLLMFSYKPPEFTTTDIYKYMCTVFVDDIRKCLHKGGFSYKNPEGGEIGGTFLVAYKDNLFKIEDDFQVAESLNGVDAIGCGEDFALGALYAMSEQKISTKDKVLKALEAAESLAISVRRPFVICETE